MDVYHSPVLFLRTTVSIGFPRVIVDGIGEIIKTTLG
jgi:hypothetical protein